MRRVNQLFPFIVLLVLLGLGVWLLSRRSAVPVRRGPGASFAFDHPVERAMPETPFAREVSPLPVMLDHPLNLCVGPSGLIYVVGDQRLVTLRPDGTAGDLSIDLSGTGCCVAVGVDETIYVGIGNTIQPFSPTGEPLASWPPPAADAVISEIAVSGEIAFVTDRVNATLYRYRLDGEILEYHRGFTLFSSPVLGVSAATDGTFWVANPGKRELRHYAGDGRLLAQWQRQGRGADGFSGCCNPISVCVLDADHLLVSEKHILRVKVVGSDDGAFVGMVAGPDAFDPQTEHLNVAVDAVGRFLVLDGQTRVVRVFERMVR